jgi:hypothetical protein
MGLKLDLEELFGRRVDLLTPRCLSPEMRARVEKDLVYVSVISAGLFPSRLASEMGTGSGA